MTTGRSTVDVRTGDAARARVAVIVCAYNEERYIGACLRSLIGQRRSPDDIVVVDNASCDRTGDIARGIAGVRVVREERKGLVHARAAGALASNADLLLYLDADCRAPADWVARVERCFVRQPHLVAMSGTYRFYDWHAWGRILIRTYDLSVAPATHLLVNRILRCGAVFYGGNFAVRRTALDAIGGFDTSIEFHGEDTNLGRRLAAIGGVALRDDCFVMTSARRYRTLGTWAVVALYVRNFWSELLLHRPADTTHLDVRNE